MAHRLFGRGLRYIPSKCDSHEQPFKYLLVLDFEATCEREVKLHPQEIIEFPCVALSTEDWQVKSVFHKYVKPKVNPVLTPFCTELTGILQENVDKQQYFPKVFSEFNMWLRDGGFLRDKSAFVTCGDWDLRVMLPDQCALDGLEVPEYCERWIDLKKSYCEATKYYPKGLRDMLIKSRLPMEGQLHSGICDVRNMCRIIIELVMKHNAVFRINSKVGESIKNYYKA